MEGGNSIISLLAADEYFEKTFSKLNLPAALYTKDFTLLIHTASYPAAVAEINSSKIETDSGHPFALKLPGGNSLNFIPIIYSGTPEGFIAAEAGGEGENAADLKNIKHDLNNIITLILNLISMKQSEENIRAGIDLAGSLLSGAFGKAGIPPATDLSARIKNIIAVYNDGRIIIADKIKTSLFPVKMKEDNVIRVITNLITNSIEALGGKGEIRVEAYNDTADNGKRVCIKIKDNGPGIPRSALNEIFNPGYSTKQRGSGIGLSIVKSIIEADGGTIEAKSTLGEGTEFIIIIPSSAAKRRIALVEDEPFLNEVLTSQLASDYEVLNCLDAESFLKEFKSYKPELVIIDKKLPGMQGTECITEIRRIDKEVKIIFASGSDIEGKSGPANIDRFIRKPYNFDELSSGIEELLG